jgi:anti-sigma factor RsiW
MNDSEFIELLNLYLDHEISAADAARLEAEVLNNPARRKVYQDYCRMQKACKILAEDFVEESAPAPDNVVAFEGARPTSRAGWIATGALAAAACVAIVFVSTQQHTQSSQKADIVREVPVAIPSGRVAADSERSLPRSVSVPVTAHEETQAIPVTALSLATNNNATTTERFVSSADQTAPQFAWMSAVQLPPMQRASLEDFRYDSRSRADARPYARPQPGQPPTEWTAIRWEKR